MNSSCRWWQWESTLFSKEGIWAVTCDFQQCGILTCVDSDKPVQPSVKVRNSKSCSVSSVTVVEYLSDKQRLWSVCVYAQAGLSHCWSHIPHCWKSHVTAHIWFAKSYAYSALALSRLNMVAIVHISLFTKKIYIPSTQWKKLFC